MKILKEAYTIPDNVVMFYDRHLRLWTLYIKDEEGNQISDTEYTSSKADAIDMAQDITNFRLRESLEENNMRILKELNESLNNEELNEWFQVSPYEDGNRILRDAVSKVFSSTNKSRLIKVATNIEPNYPYSFATTSWARQGNDYTHASIQMKVGYSELCSFYIGWENEEIISRTNIGIRNDKLYSVAYEVIKEFNNIFTQEKANFEKVIFLESVNEGLQYIENINSRKGIRQLKESTNKFSIFIDTDQEPDRDILLDANSLEDAKQKANELSKKHGGYKVIVNDSNHKSVYCARRGRACESLTETYHINDEEVMNKVAELGKELESQGFKYVNSKDSRDYYDFYRKIEDGKGIWKAIIYNYGAAEIIDVTYEQARGIEPIDSLEQLRKDLGKMLLPNNSINEALGRDYSHIPEVKQINYSNNKNGNLLPYLDCNAFKAALEETGLEAFKIKSARLKGVSLGDLKDEFSGRGMQPWKWTHDFDSSIPMGDGNEFEIFWKGEFPNKIEEDFSSDNWLLIKDSRMYDPEGLNINTPESILCKGSKEECINQFNEIVNSIKLKVAKDRNSRFYDSCGPSILISAKGDLFIKVYYPNAAAYEVYQVLPNTIEEKLQNEKEDTSEEKEDAKLNEDIEVPTLEGPNEGAEYGLSELINAAIQHELETVNEYNVLALNARAEGYDDIASVIDEINTEENKHIGQLQELLKTVSPNAQAIVAGETEASDDLVNVDVE